MQKLLIVILLVSYCKAYGQQNQSVSFHFKPLFEKSNVQTDVYYKINNNDSLQIETLKFYISNVQLLYNDSIVFKEQYSYHLIDAAENKSLVITLPLISSPKYNQIQFNLGIDSVTNVSGAMGGDLDPTKGMYWTWQSGYINAKIEGSSNICNTRNNVFQLHLGGYQYPFNALQLIKLKTKQESTNKIYINLQKFFASADLAKQNQIMSPSLNAVLISALLAACFYTDGL